MIITRTPFRISFFGGGTDYPVWYREHGGAVLSTTFNKYCYISCRYLPPFFDYKYLVRYRIREEEQRIADVKHPSVRECVKYLRFEKGLEIIHTSDIPARSGVGSSSSFTVGLLNALYALQGKLVTKRHLVREAIHVEQHLIGENVGCQDQVAAAFGGFNKIEFFGENDFYVYPITLTQERLDRLQSHLLLFFTGFARNASEIAGEQIRQTSNRKTELMYMKEMVDEAIRVLNRESDELSDFGKLLHEAWRLKRGLTEYISNSHIDAIYETAIKAGAIGGKLLGAGGGGFMVFFSLPEHHRRIREELERLVHVPFGFERLGSQVVMYSTQEIY